MTTPSVALRSFGRRHAVKLVASVLITGGVVYTIRKGGLKLVPDGGDFAAVHWWALVAYIPLALAMLWYRSVRWRFLLRSVIDVPRLRVFAVSCAGFAAILLLPFRIGELARPYMLRSRPGDPGPVLTMTAATSSIIAERVFDGLFLSIVLAVVLVFVPTVQPLPEQVIGLPISVAAVRASAWVILAGFGCGFVALAVFYFARTLAHRLTLRVVGAVSPAFANRLVALLERLADGLHALGRPRDALGFLVETTAYWGLNAVGIWVLAIGCGVVHADGSAITFAEACGLMGMLGCAIMIPGPPGLFGVFQAGLYAGMTMYYPTAIVIGPGAAFVFLLYAAQVVITFATGGWGYWRERARATPAA